MIKVWIVDKALTSGVITVEVEKERIDKNNRVRYFPLNGHYVINHAFLTEEEAIAKVEKIRLRKIKNLERNLAKMRNLIASELVKNAKHLN